MVKSAKAKIRRANKNYGVDLKDEIELPKITDFETRKEYNEWKQEIKSFTNRANLNYQFVKNDYGVVASKKKIREIEELTKEAKRQAEEKVEKFMKYPQVEKRMNLMQKPLEGMGIPRDFNFNEVKNKERLDTIENNMKKRLDQRYQDKIAQQFKENFMWILYHSMHSDANELVSLIEDIPADDFYEIYMLCEDDDKKVFDFDMWDSDRGYLAGGVDEGREKVSQMLLYVRKYFEGDIDMSLKGF